MRLLFVSNVYPNPLEPLRGNFNLAMLKSLAAEHSVSVISPVAWTDELGHRCRGRRMPAAREAAIGGIPARYPRYYFPPKMLRSRYGSFMWHSVRELVLDQLRYEPPDVILGYWTHPDGAVALRAARRVGCPCVIMVGGSDVLLLAKERSRRRAMAKTLCGADAVITLSRDLKQHVEALGVPGDRVHVVYRGVDTTLFTPGDRCHSRRKLGLPLEIPTVVWVGRMVPVKGLPVLLHACSLLKDRRKDFAVHIVGYGPMRPAIEQQIASTGLVQHVFLTGAVPNNQLPDWYRAADVTILPSQSEGTPNVLMESIACGTPFIASRVGGIPDLATEPMDRLVAVGDAQGLADAVVSMLASPSRGMPRRFVPCSWEDAAQLLLTVIDPLVAPSSDRT